MKGTLIHHQSTGTKQLAVVESGAHLAQGDNYCKLIGLGSGDRHALDRSYREAKERFLLIFCRLFTKWPQNIV